MITGKIELHSYKNAFNEGKNPPKLRPGFKIGQILYVLTQTEPKLTPFVQIEPGQISGKHFNPKERAYLTTAYDQKAPRYNNVSGGYLEITDKIKSFVGDELEDYIII
jgi:hypothetical protein